MLLFPIAFLLWLTAIVITILVAGICDFTALISKFWNDPPKRRVEYYLADRLTNVVPLKKADHMTIKRGMGARFLQQ